MTRVFQTIGGVPLLPRTQVLSVGYAIEASRIGGLSAEELLGPAAEAIRSGAGLEWLSDSQIRVRPGVLGFSDGKARKNTAPLTWDFSNGVGPLGLDTGSEAPAIWLSRSLSPPTTTVFANRAPSIVESATADSSFNS